MWRFSIFLQAGRAFIYLLVALQTVTTLLAAEGLRTFDFSIRALVYDPFTAKIYATSPGGLLQLDPDSGQLLRTFPLGENLSRLQLGGAHGLWIGLDGEGAVRRFNLETLAAEAPLIVKAGMLVNDISPSRFDPYTLVVALVSPALNNPHAFLIRNGTLLPNAVSCRYVALAVEGIIGQDTGNLLTYQTDPFGLNGPINSTYSGGGASPMKISNGVMYSGRGVVWPEPYAILASTYLPIFPLLGAVTINEETREILYLSAISGRLELNRFAPPLHHTGNYVVPGVPPIDPTPLTLAAWSSNRLAFHTTSNLYLVDLDKVFSPSDVEVLSQDIAPANALFGQPVTVTLTVTNHGPGAALNVVVTNLFSPGTLLVAEGQPASRTNAVLQPGESVELSATILPSTPGTLITRAGVSAENDRNHLNDAREFSFSVAREHPRTIRIADYALDMAFDAGSGRLFYANNFELAMIEPAVPRLLRPIGLPYPQRMAMDAAGGSLVLGFIPDGDRNTLTLSQIDPASFQQTVPPGTFFGSILDLKISPKDRELIVTTDTLGTILSRHGSYTQLDRRTGYLGFSEDGSIVYRSDAETCALDSFTVGPGGVVFEKRVTNVACGDFAVSGSLLIFNSGIVYNAASGDKRSLGIVPPMFASAPALNLVDVLHRTNGVWSITRFETPNLQTRLTVSFPELPPNIFGAVSAGENRMALRTGSEIYIVELTGASSGLRAVKKSANEVELHLDTTAGNRYRIERSSTLNPGSWTAFGAEIVGNGYIAARTVSPTDSQSASFYRVAELSTPP